MKLRTVLSQHALTDLKKIAEASGLVADPRSNKTILMDQLCKTLPDTENILAKLSLLSAEQRHLVIGLSAEGGELPEEEAIEELCDGFVHRFHAHIDALTEMGLVFRDASTLGPTLVLVGLPDAYLKSISIPKADQGRLRSIMKPMSTGLLRDFAQEINLTITDTRRPLLIQAIRNALLLSDTLRPYLQSLSEEKRAILDFFLSRESTTYQDVSQALGEHLNRDLEDLVWKTPFFYAPEGDLTRPEAPICLAPDLRNALNNIAKNQGGQLESQLEDVIETTPTAPSKIHDNAPHLLQDLATLLGLIERKWPRRLKRGGIPKGDLRDATHFCHGESDPGYVEFLSLFVETSGLVQAEGTIWRVADDAGTRLGQEIDIRKTMFLFWQQTDRWNEWASDRVTGTTRSTRMNDLQDLRQEIVKGLQTCEPEKWITYASFYQFLMRFSDRFKQFADTPGSGRNLATSGTTADELLRRILSATLSWMGVVRIGNIEAFTRPLRKNHQAVFQLTRSGSALVHSQYDQTLLEGMPPQNPNSKFVIQPNYEILAPPDLPYAHYLTLCALADLQTQDVMTCFHVSREALQQAMNRGLSGSDIRTFFTQHSATGLPEMIDALISECENKYGEIEITPAAGYLSVDSETMLDELYAQKRIAETLGKRLSPTTAALASRTKPEALVQVLHQQGYMPHVSREQSLGREDRHQIIFTTLEVSELVGYLEASSALLAEKSDVQLDDILHLAKRIKRALRQASDEPRAKAAQQYQNAFQQIANGKTIREEGLEDLLRFTSTNPATSSADIRTIINYAIDHRLRVEITYGPTEEAPKRLIEPFAEDHAMLYAFCQTRNGDRVFRLDKIHFARLTSERFHRTT